MRVVVVMLLNYLVAVWLNIKCSVLGSLTMSNFLPVSIWWRWAQRQVSRGRYRGLRVSSRQGSAGAARRSDGG